jgi:hypothetical protein
MRFKSWPDSVFEPVVPKGFAAQRCFAPLGHDRLKDEGFH